MIVSSPRLHRPLAALLAVILVASGVPSARATGGTVVADSGSGNGIASGRVVRADPDNARVTVTNGFHFWAALDVSYVGGSNFLRFTDPRVDMGGIYAGGGLIGPGGTAAWDGRFSAASQALVRVHYDLSSAGGAAALAANLLTIIADSLGASLSASSPDRLLIALKTVTDLSSWADFVRQAQTNDIWGLVTSVELMLGSKTGRDTLRYALSQLGVIATDADLLRVASVVGIIDWAWTLFDIYRAVLLGQNDGTVIFSVAPPVVTPGPTTGPTPTTTSRPTGTVTGPVATYVVQAGDTAQRIAITFGISLSELQQANPAVRNWDRLAVGQTLLIPTPGSAATPAETPAALRANELLLDSVTPLSETELRIDFSYYWDGDQPPDTKGPVYAWAIPYGPGGCRGCLAQQDNHFLPGTGAGQVTATVRYLGSSAYRVTTIQLGLSSDGLAFFVVDWPYDFTYRP